MRSLHTMGSLCGCRSSPTSSLAICPTAIALGQHREKSHFPHEHWRISTVPPIQTGCLAWKLACIQPPEKQIPVSARRAARAFSKLEGGAAGESRSSTSEGKSIREYDVVIIGAGIIGVATANHILQHTQFSVAVIDAARPCAGATGAGQGYIWMSHRSPENPGWGLASRSKQLWDELAVELKASGVDPEKAFGFRRTGSLLVASTTSEAESLRECITAASAAGAPAMFLSAAEARKLEPSLSIDHLAAAALYPEDFQIDARLAMELLLQRARAFSSSGRYTEIFETAVEQFMRSPVDGAVKGVEVPGLELYCRKAVVLATGAWSSTLMTKATVGWDLSVVPPVKPRKGHLLVIGGADTVQVKHGIMEFEYINSAEPSHTQDVSESEDDALRLAMTATMDQYGNLLLGSSREFVGFNTGVQNGVVESMINRAAKFLGNLSHLTTDWVLQNGSCRTGFRPFISDGRPLIGTVPEVPGLVFATGHEGSGLTLSLGTAEMVGSIIQGTKCIVDPEYFSPKGRLRSSMM